MDYLGLEAGEIYLRQGEGRTLKRVHQRSQGIGALWRDEDILLGEGMVGKTAAEGQSELLTLQEFQDPGLNPDLELDKLHQVACFALAGRRGVLGVLCVATNTRQPLGDLEMQFLNAISSWIGTTIENVRLNTQQRRLAVLEERERIGMDLHDGVIQSIYAVGLTLEHARLLMNEDPKQATRRVEQAITDLNSTIRDIRAYILDLRPRQLNNEDLMQGLNRLVTEFRANVPVEVELHGPADGMADLPDAPRWPVPHCFRKPWRTCQARPRQKGHRDLVVDQRSRLAGSHRDGRGFDPKQVRLTLGHGLPNMQTRARTWAATSTSPPNPMAGRPCWPGFLSESRAYSAWKMNICKRLPAREPSTCGAPGRNVAWR
jgi:DNA-directed RNA polymerase subunit F